MKYEGTEKEMLTQLFYSLNDACRCWDEIDVVPESTKIVIVMPFGLSQVAVSKITNVCDAYHVVFPECEYLLFYKEKELEVSIYFLRKTA